MDKGAFKIFIVIVFSAASLFFLIPLATGYQRAFLAEKGVVGKDILYKALGETRKILADSAFMKGDEYLHGGVVAKDKSKCQEIERMPEHVKDARAYTHRGHPRRERKEGAAVPVWNILPYLGGVIHISEHVHLHGEEEKELLPWFYYAVRLDPNNVDAYVIGGYWIGSRMNKPDEAIKFLKEGLANNPDSWRIYAQLGEIYFINKKDYEQVLTNMQKACELFTGENSDKFDKKEVYTFMAASYEKLGETDKANEFYGKILALFPEDKAALEKICR